MDAPVADSCNGHGGGACRAPPVRLAECSSPMMRPRPAWGLATGGRFIAPGDREGMTAGSVHSSAVPPAAPKAEANTNDPNAAVSSVIVLLSLWCHERCFTSR